MSQNKPLVVIRGAGDLASGVAYRIFNSGLDVIMTEIERPLVVRRTVSFAEAVYAGKITIEGIDACLAGSVEEALALLDKRTIPVLVDPEAAVVKLARPTVVVDARMAKRNLGITIEDAPLVIGLGPGFTAGVDVHVVIETCRGHRLGRAIYSGSAIPDTGAPGAVDGYTLERLLRAPVDGVVLPRCSIGEQVGKGDPVALVETTPVYAAMTGLVRGMLKEGLWVPKGTKIGDIDPRKDAEYDTISDKALAVGGGVLEAIYHYIHKGT
ncbi:MAG: selenium-dependent molybdenum cofactor biosynthesis protein YqeB [Desulfotomaculaceae bacterium]|nr:selenium-dependent molybdenum cofactor biosynthesis protein YqeB [Desulfotomaculaceae bacterium]